MKYTIYLSALVCSLFFIFSTKAHAITAFARATEMECSTCHTVFPELTEAGSNFKKNGFVWLGKKKAKKDATKEFLILSSIPAYIPLSISSTFMGSYDKSRDAGNRFDMELRAIRLQAGGNFNEKIGFFLSYNLYTAQDLFDNTISSNVPKNNIPDLDEAYAMGRHIFDTPINLKVGRFQPGISLWEKNDKVSVSSNITTSYMVGNSLFSEDASADGVELNSVVSPRVFVTAGGIKRKNVSRGDGYLSARYKMGGTDYNGKDAKFDFNNETFLNYLTVTIGGYGYVGTNQTGTEKNVNSFYRTGLESDIGYKKFRLKLASAFGNDKKVSFDPFAVTSDYKSQKSKAFSAETSLYVMQSLVPSLRYEYLDNGIKSNSYIAALSYAPLQNVKLVTEYKVHTVSGSSSNGILNLALVGAF